jgi:RimJ/RimL family protein N-acetyltransferase
VSVDKPTLRGEMLVLRPIRAADADAMWDLVTDPETRRLTGSSHVWTRPEVDAFCVASAADPTRIDLAVTSGDADEYLGEIVLEAIDETLASARLRLVMRPGYRGRGYGTEAISLVLGLAFDGLALHRVEIDVLSINTRAQAIYENLGFRVEGRRRDAYRDGERWCDGIVMSLLDDEYRATQPG